MPRTVDQKTQRWLESQGYIWSKVECACIKPRLKRDAFGFIDYIAINGKRIIGVQATDHTNFGKHVTKIRAAEDFERVAAAMPIIMVGFKPDQDEPHRVECVIPETPAQTAPDAP